MNEKTRTIHHWRGASGRWYAHTVFPLPATLPVTAGNFIFARDRPDGLFDPLYVGETESTATPLSQHEMLSPALRLSATHVHVHYLAKTSAGRRAIAADLSRSFRPPLNDPPAHQGALQVVSGRVEAVGDPVDSPAPTSSPGSDLLDLWIKGARLSLQSVPGEPPPAQGPAEIP